MGLFTSVYELRKSHPGYACKRKLTSNSTSAPNSSSDRQFHKHLESSINKL